MPAPPRQSNRRRQARTPVQTRRKSSWLFPRRFFLDVLLPTAANPSLSLFYFLCDHCSEQRTVGNASGTILAVRRHYCTFEAARIQAAYTHFAAGFFSNVREYMPIG